MLLVMLFLTEVTVVSACSHQGSFANPHYENFNSLDFHIFYIWPAPEWTGLVCCSSQKNTSFKSKNRNTSIGFEPAYSAEVLICALHSATSTT